MKLEDYEKIVQEIDAKTNEFERKTHLDNSSNAFIKRSTLKMELQQISDNLWHFHQILDQIVSKDDTPFLGIGEYDRHDFNTLHSDSKYICRKARNIKEGLSSLLELHINTVSYEMNNVMKAIAVITCLAIIPSLIGGILGVNLISASGISIGFQLDPTEVLFLVFSSMFLGMYAFYIKGWLR